MLHARLESCVTLSPPCRVVSGVRSFCMCQRRKRRSVNLMLLTEKKKSYWILCKLLKLLSVVFPSGPPPPIFEPGTHSWNVARIFRIGFTYPCGSQVRREYVFQGSQSSRLSVLSCTFHIFIQNVSSVHRANVQKGEFGWNLKLCDTWCESSCIPRLCWIKLCPNCFYSYYHHYYYLSLKEAEFSSFAVFVMSMSSQRL